MGRKISISQLSAAVMEELEGVCRSGRRRYEIGGKESGGNRPEGY